MQVLGREDERITLRDFVGSIPSGLRALLIEGEAGIGKTTLWDEGLRIASQAGFRILTSRPVEAEASLSFTALGDVLETVLGDSLPELPSPQRRALEIALLRAEVTDMHPDYRAVSLAALGALRHLVVAGPVLLAIDDAQWLDASSARVLGFVIRRLEEDPVGILATSRDEPKADPLGLERLSKNRCTRISVGPLSVGALGRVLRAHLPIELPRPVLARLHGLSEGNPLFALEMARRLPARDEWSESGEALPVPGKVEPLLQGRLAGLPPDALEVVRVAAVAARPTLELVGDVLGDGDRARSGLAAAVDAGVIVREGRTIRFSHPLFGSTAHASIPARERRALHGRLATVVADPEERARQFALATEGPDTVAADALEAAAEGAHGRGAPDAAASLSELARRLTPETEPEAIRRRTRSAARYHFDGGDVPRARLLLREELARSSPGPERAEVLWLMAETAWNDMRTIRQLLEQALEEVGDHARMRALINNDLGWVAMLGATLALAAGRSRAALEAAERSGDHFLLALCLGTLGQIEFLSGRPSQDLMERGVREYESLLSLATYGSPKTYLGWQRMIADDLDGGRALLEEEYRTNEERGHVTIQWEVLEFLTELECRAGNWRRADRYAAEAMEITLEAGIQEATPGPLSRLALVEALTGRIEDARAHASEGLKVAEPCQDTWAVIRNRSVLGFLELSLGNPAGARDALAPLPGVLEEIGVAEPGAFPLIPDLVEALVVVGKLVEASTLAEGLEERGRALDRALALATAARCRGLVAAASGDLVGAAVELDRALEEHARLAHPFELARTLLVTGEVRRRARQKREARASLERALGIFQGLGAPLWAARARAELERVGGRVPGVLTPTERRVAELVAEGRTNREVADALFVSVKTVEANLSRIYAKLGIRSRTELAREILAGDGRPQG